MNLILRKASFHFLGDEETRKLWIFTIMKFVLFDLFWSIQTTFTSFSTPELYVNAITFSMLLLLPYMIKRNLWIYVVIFFILDAIMVSNLMYNRTYNSSIPLDSYTRASNLNDFKSSVVDSVRWYDVLFPISTFLYIYFCIKNKWKHTKECRWKNYLSSTGVFVLLSILLVAIKGGPDKAKEKLETKNLYTCGAPMYTVFGTMLYELSFSSHPVMTTDIKSDIDSWLNSQPKYIPLANDEKRTNLVVIYCESLESWVINRTLEGHVITPNLNKLINEPTTLYAPYVLTQVRDGRSIDAQLMISTGILPISNGSYAFMYPTNTFPSIIKAMKERNPKTRSNLLTVDNSIIWNQGVIAKKFGIDNIICKKDWEKTETIGPKNNLSDQALFDQTIERMKKTDLWHEGTNAYTQIVTYSGHGPFIIPDNLKRIHLKGNYPEKLADYVTTANYTDHAISSFIEYLKSRSDWKNTLVVITGDHEGLAADREELCDSKAGKGLVSPKQFTPFIVLNSPIHKEYKDVMGQIDIYPTLLNLMHLDNYKWKGMGQSILAATKIPVAIGSRMNFEGKSALASQKQLQHIKDAYKISDMIMRYNYFACNKKFKCK